MRDRRKAALKAWENNRESYIEKFNEAKLNRRKEFIKYCKWCDKLISYEKRHNIFCSRSCARSYNNSNLKKRILVNIERQCDYCSKTYIILSGRSNLYCSIKCKKESEYENYIKEWLNGNNTGGYVDGSIHQKVKRWVRQKYHNRCSLCGWDKVNLKTGSCPVNVDHIDGNPENHKPENLRLICPNCHSLTPTYGSLNIGKGRKYRYKWKKEDSI